MITSNIEAKTIDSKFLPEDTPIVMLWIVKDVSKLKHDQLPLPNNQLYQYKHRLLDLAKQEPQRQIKLYYFPPDLTLEQKQKLHNLSNIEKGGKSNIEIIDFSAKFKDEHDLTFLKSENIAFAWKIDTARLIVLLEDGPAIYLDFDVFTIGNKKIGKIPMNDVGYKVAPSNAISEDLENSIIVVDSKDNFIISAIYDKMKNEIKDVLADENANNNLKSWELWSENFVWTLHSRAATYVYDKLQKGLAKGEIAQMLKRSGLTEVKLESDLSYERRDAYFSHYGLYNRGDGSWERGKDTLYAEGILKDILLKAERKEGNVNIIDLVKELKKWDESLYKEWEKDDFNINHLFYDDALRWRVNHWTLLHCAARYHYIRVIDALLKDSMIDVNAKDIGGNTPLYLAIESAVKNFNDNPDTIERLMNRGADPHLSGHLVTPIELATENKKMQILNELNYKTQNKEAKLNMLYKMDKAAEQVYNSYLLWHKLDELKVNNGQKLQKVVAEAIDKNYTRVGIKVKDRQYTVQINKVNDYYRLKVSSGSATLQIKHISRYTDILMKRLYCYGLIAKSLFRREILVKMSGRLLLIYMMKLGRRI